MSLEVGSVSVAPCPAADVVYVAGVCDGQHEGGCLDIVEFLYVAGEYVY